MSMNAKMDLMVAIAMLFVTILKAPTNVFANQDFRRMEKTAAKVSSSDNSSDNARDLRSVVPHQPAALSNMM